MNIFNFFYGHTFIKNYTNKTIINNNLNTIKAFYLTHPTNSSDRDERTGHAITILKIQNKWYISDNEVGLLHKVNDTKFISILFYKLYHADNPKYEICQMWHTTKEQQSAQNLIYFFVFDLAGKQYTYPHDNVPGLKDIHTPVVNAERTIIFTYTEEKNDPLLEEIRKKITLSEAEFINSL
jgi:hypothetical protein